MEAYMRPMAAILSLFLPFMMARLSVCRSLSVCPSHFTITHGGCLTSPFNFRLYLHCTFASPKVCIYTTTDINTRGSLYETYVTSFPPLFTTGNIACVLEFWVCLTISPLHIALGILSISSPLSTYPAHILTT